MALQTGPVKSQEDFDRKYSPAQKQIYDQILTLKEQGRLADAKEMVKKHAVNVQSLKEYVSDGTAVKLALLDKQREEAIRERQALLVQRQHVIDTAAKKLAPKVAVMTGNSYPQNGMRVVNK